ncbi:MAG: peroxiredoxin family protein, partial [Pirellulaceae bacterium]
MHKRFRSFQVLSWVLTLVLLGGCGTRSSSQRLPEEKQKLGPVAVLQQMLATYRDAASYCDRGVLRLSFRRDGQRFEDQSPLSVRTRAQNQLRLHAYRATVICDGERFFAQIEDDATQDIDGQVLVTDAPPALDLKYLYRDTVLRDALASGLGRQPVQLELLYTDRPLEALFQPEVTKELLTPRDFDGRMCYRVKATTEEGDFVLWIDRKLFLLRRLEYPVTSLMPQLAQDREVSDATLIAEFTAARLNHGLPAGSFRIVIPENAKQVRSFVLPPQPLPSELLGQRPDVFSFTSLDGDRVDAGRLSGRNAVLVWFHDHPACRACLKRLEEVHRRYQSGTDTRFYAVCTEPASRSNDSLQKLMADWQVTVPLVRDLEAFGRDVFHIPWAPTMVVLDSRGMVQAFEVGANP